MLEPRVEQKRVQQAFVSGSCLPTTILCSRLKGIGLARLMSTLARLTKGLTIDRSASVEFGGPGGI